ncbi:hypothetical protein M885DRAFT_510229, partial [Pelagophyceae sp. CCMP2097]
VPIKMSSSMKALSAPAIFFVRMRVLQPRQWRHCRGPRWTRLESPASCSASVAVPVRRYGTRPPLRPDGQLQRRKRTLITTSNSPPKKVREGMHNSGVCATTRPSSPSVFRLPLRLKISRLP